MIVLFPSPRKLKLLSRSPSARRPLCAHNGFPARRGPGALIGGM